MPTKIEPKNGSLLNFLGHRNQFSQTHSQPCYQSKMVTEVLTTEENHSRELRMMDKKVHGFTFQDWS